MTHTFPAVLFINATLFDGNNPHPQPHCQLLVNKGRIERISNTTIDAKQARIIDLQGKTLMPGLIDCHVHVVASTANLGANALLPDSLVSARASKLMNQMLAVIALRYSWQ